MVLEVSVQPVLPADPPVPSALFVLSFLERERSGRERSSARLGGCSLLDRLQQLKSAEGAQPGAMAGNLVDTSQLMISFKAQRHMEIVQGVITSSGLIWVSSCQTADREQARPVLQSNSGKQQK